MLTKIYKQRAKLSSAMLALAAIAASAAMGATTFTPGNVIVARITGTAALAAKAQELLLDEYTPAGVLVQSISLGSSTAVSGSRLYVTGNSSLGEAQITLSSDHKYVIVGGYDCAFGTATPGGSAANVVNRVIARVPVLSDPSVIDYTTVISDSNSPGEVHGVCSDGDGGHMWMGTQNLGIRYVAYGTSGNSQLISGSGSTIRTVSIFGGQLYDNILTVINQVGTGLPITGSQTNAPVVNTGTALFQNAFESIGPVGSGNYGRIWTADTNTAESLDHFDYVGPAKTNWNKTSNVGSLTRSQLGCALGQDGTGNPVVFTASGSAAANAFVRVDRSSGVATTLATAATNNVFRSVVVIPDSTPPTMSSIALADSSTTNGATVHFTVTFDQKVFNAQASNFTLTGSGVTTATIGVPSTSDNVTWTVPVTNVASPNGGTLGLDKAASNYIQDATGNILMGGAVSGPQYSITDNVAPTVTAVATVDHNNVDVTFSEPMGSGATTAANYAVSGAGQGTLAANPDSVVNTTGNTYRLTWNTGSTVTGSPVTVTASPSVQDVAGNGTGSPSSASDPTALPVDASLYQVD